MWLFIEATDVWLFRDGRPFDAGSDHRAASVFPPPPTTIQGALRTELLNKYGVSFADYAQGKDISADIVNQIGTADNSQPGQMWLRGPFIARRQDDDKIMPYFATPSDILQINKDADKEKGQAEIHRLLPLKPTDPAPFSANWPAETPQLHPCTYDEAAANGSKPEGGLTWISALGMQAYLAGNISTENFGPPTKERAAYRQWVKDTETALDAAGKLGWVHLKRAGQLFGTEYRLGIGIDEEHKRPSDGKLYTAAFVRPRQNVGLLVEVTGLDESQWRTPGVFSLGGERKTARYSLVEPAHWPTSAADGRKLYLATPTQFDGGWQPKNWGDYFPQAGPLTAVLVGRPQLIGGWDMAQGRPKPMRRYVPATSVYFFANPLRPDDNDTKTANVSICDDKAAGQIGFGTTFIGRW